MAFRAALAVDNARAYNDAQAANRLKDEFLATLSHELRTPLNAILGYSRLLQSGMMTADKHAHALQTVERNATSLTKIVEDILDVSRIISGKIRLNVQPVDLPDRGVECGRNGHARGGSQADPRADDPRSRAQPRSPAIRIACSRSSGISSRMP